MSVQDIDGIVEIMKPQLKLLKLLKRIEDLQYELPVEYKNIGNLSRDLIILLCTYKAIVKNRIWQNDLYQESHKYIPDPEIVKKYNLDVDDKGHLIYQ